MIIVIMAGISLILRKKLSDLGRVSVRNSFLCLDKKPWYPIRLIANKSLIGSQNVAVKFGICLLYTSDAADE